MVIVSNPSVAYISKTYDYLVVFMNTINRLIRHGARLKCHNAASSVTGRFARLAGLRVCQIGITARCHNELSRSALLWASIISVLNRHDINIVGTGSRTMLFAHGYGCDQIMWRYLCPLSRATTGLCFDHVGAGKSDLSQYNREKYGSLQGNAVDVLEIINAVSGAPVIFVGHSVSAMIGVLTANRRPEAFERLIMIGPSPCYIIVDASS